MAIPKFPSKFVKLGVNCEDGDILRFLDAPAMDADDKLIGTVGIIQKGFKDMTEKKKFQINKTNYKAIAMIHGEDTENWKNKEVQVYEGRANNPQTGVEGPSLKIKAVGGETPEDVNEFLNR